MAWNEYDAGELAARTYELTKSVGKETWTHVLHTSVANWERDVTIIEYAADGWSETGAADALAALIEDGAKNTGSSRSGESGKYIINWTEETYGEWGLA